MLATAIAFFCVCLIWLGGFASSQNVPLYDIDFRIGTVVCTGGKEWKECGTTCPLTCENYDSPPLVCTLQCVQGCFCPRGMADLNGVCVEPSVCDGCRYCGEGQECFATHYGYAHCKDPIAVSCSPETSLACPNNSRCLTHNITGTSFCLESCYLQNGGCSDEQVCYSERKDEDCNPLLESCFKTTCTDIPTNTDSCPSGWMLNPCGSLCQRTCEDYLTGSRIACPEICAPPDCVCPRGLVVFRDRCVDPLECYSLLTDAPGLNPLPLPKDSVLLQVTLVRVKIEDIDGTQFAEDVARLVKELGFNDVEVSLYALLGDEDGNTVIVLWFQGDSISRDKSAGRLVDIMLENPDKLSHEVAAVSSVDSRAVSEGNGGSDVSSDSPSAGVIAGVVVAVTVVCAALAVLVVIAVVYLAQTKRPQIVNSKSDDLELPIKGKNEELL